LQHRLEATNTSPSAARYSLAAPTNQLMPKRRAGSPSAARRVNRISRPFQRSAKSARVDSSGRAWRGSSTRTLLSPTRPSTSQPPSFSVASAGSGVVSRRSKREA
jgi:hypothetical protein